MENECDAQSAFIKSHRALRDTTILNSPFSILNLFYKNKKAPVPDFSWDRSEYALAVPPRLTQTASTLLTHRQRARPWITGGDVAVTGSKLPAFALPSPFTFGPAHNHTACGSLGGLASLLLVFVIGLCWFTWYGHSIFAKRRIVKCNLRKTIYYFCYKFLL